MQLDSLMPKSQNFSKVVKPKAHWASILTGGEGRQHL